MSSLSFSVLTRCFPKPLSFGLHALDFWIIGNPSSGIVLAAEYMLVRPQFFLLSLYIKTASLYEGLKRVSGSLGSLGTEITDNVLLGDIFPEVFE